jgi:ATP-binding cassette subfamily B protein
VSHSLAHAGAFGILYDLRMRIARKLANVPLGFFDRKDTGALQKAMSEDVGGLEQFLAHMLPDAAAAFTVPLVAIVLLFVVDWRMALASLVVVPFAVASQALMAGKKSQEAWEKYHAINEDTKRSILEYLRGIHVVKTFGLDAQSFGKLKASVERMDAYVEDYAKRSAPAYIVAMKLLGGGTNALFIVPIGLWLHARGSLDTATLVFFLLVATQVLSPFLRIANVLGNLQRLLHGADNIQRILHAQELDPGRGAQPTRGDLRFEQVSFAYEETPVLRGLSFTAPEGKVTAIVGPSGAGKSTVVRLISRFWDPNEGRISIGNDDVKHVSLDAHLARLSMVFQDVFLFYGSVRDNLRIAKPDATDAELERACRAARIHDVVTALPEGYDMFIGERGARLSGGERQRLSIARAILKDAPILLLDEATAFADAENEALIQEALREGARGRTLVVIAHRLSTIRHADRIVVLSDGVAVDQGTHDELLPRCSVYRELWKNYDDAAHWELGKVAAGAEVVS